MTNRRGAVYGRYWKSRQGSPFQLDRQEPEMFRNVAGTKDSCCIKQHL